MGFVAERLKQGHGHLPLLGDIVDHQNQGLLLYPLPIVSVGGFSLFGDIDRWKI